MEYSSQMMLKVVVVTYNRWLLTRGSDKVISKVKLWYFGKVVAYLRWLYREVQLYLNPKWWTKISQELFVI